MTPFLCEIIVNAQSYYLSNIGHRGEQYWHPLIAEAPRLELGTLNGNRIGVKYGTLKLKNGPENQESPFGGSRFQGLLNGSTIYPVKFRIREAGNPLFEGGLILSHYNKSTLSFTVTEANYPQFLLSHTLTENSVAVSHVSTASPAVITANGHGLIKGHEVIFENGTSSLVYNASIRNLYQVLDVSDANNFTIAQLDGTNVNGASLTGTITGAIVGIPVLRPFTFGRVEHQTEVIKKTSVTIANPELDTTKTIELFEDGVRVGTNAPGATSNVFATAPTQDIITSNTNVNVSSFQLSLSGTSRHGTTLSELAGVLATKLGLAVNTSKL